MSWEDWGIPHGSVLANQLRWHGPGYFEGQGCLCRVSAQGLDACTTLGPYTGFR